MRGYTGEDGCPTFSVVVELPDSDVGKTLRWGVELTRVSGETVWGIAEEVNSDLSTKNDRSFVLSDSSTQNQPQRVHYRLNQSRYLGAQKVQLGEVDRIRFAVWAPSAQHVEIVMAQLHDELGQELVKPENPDMATGNAIHPHASNEIYGGYIANDGQGAHSSWGPFDLTRGEDGVWFSDIDDPAFAEFELFDNCPYMYKVTRSDGSIVYRTDLYSRCQIGFGEDRPNGELYNGRVLSLDGTVSCSVVKDPDRVCEEFEEPVYPERNWLDAQDFWTQQQDGPALPTRVQDLVIYELHIGALGWYRPDNEPGTLQDAIDMLPYLRELGVNAIELLPLSEFGGGGHNWGYATSHYFAIEYAGGGRDKYKHFIRACHEHGIAVILDVVFNHYTHNAERAQWMHDTTEHQDNCYYWYEGQPDDYVDFNNNVNPSRRGTGGYLDNLSTGWAPRYWEPMVRRMFVSSLIAHVMEFNIDGFRFDQTTSIREYNKLHSDGRNIGSANAFGHKLIREATRALRIVKPNVMLMAEDHSRDLAVVTRPLDEGGLGFDATWYADFYHHLIGDTDKGSEYAKLLKTSGLDNDWPLEMSMFAQALSASGDRRVVYHESHDEAGNGRLTDRTINVAVNGAPIIGGTRTAAEARTRVVTGITLLSAGTPMFLFGEEVGAMKKFIYGRVLENREDLIALRHSYGGPLFRFYQELIAFRLGRDAIRSQNIEIAYCHDANRVLCFRRSNSGESYLVLANLSNHPYKAPGYDLFSDHFGDETWREVFNSDAGVYGGNNIGNSGAEIRCGAGRLSCILPANGLIVLERV